MSLQHAREALAELEALGVPWRIHSGEFQVPTASLIPDGLFRRLKRAGRDLLVVLSERSASAALCATGEERQRPSLRCYACGGPTFWSLPGGTYWICAACHPSGRHPEDVEWYVVTEPPWVRREAAGEPDRQRGPIDCPVCRGTRFLWYADKRWTVCPRCNSGFDGDGGGA